VPAGRPTKLTPALLTEFCRLLPVCLNYESAAAYVGVDVVTVRRWLKRGARELARLEKPGQRPRKKEAACAEFCTAVKRALAEGEIAAAGTIKKASQAGVRPLRVKRVTVARPDGTTTTTEETVYADAQWTAAAWLLERRFPDRWGRRDSVDGPLLDVLIAREVARVAGKGQKKGPGKAAPPARRRDAGG
jgi:hypothetical protein